jgi:hypothetical protein
MAPLRKYVSQEASISHNISNIPINYDIGYTNPSVVYPSEYGIRRQEKRLKRFYRAD